MTVMNQQDDEAKIKRRGQTRQSEGALADAAFDRGIHHPSLARAHRISGAVAKLWYGGGDDKVHSNPVGCVPSHTSAVAFLPPRTHWMITMANRICDSPKTKPPMDDTIFQSVNCTA